MNILPAIDIRGGKVVRLKQGRLDDQTTYSDDPLAMAFSWQAQGAHELHIVDLDGAFSGHPRNLALVKKITAKLTIPVQFGGGLRNERAIEEALASGVARVVIGTQAAASMEFLQSIIQRFGPEKIVVAIDARDGLVATQGWTVTTSQDALEMAQAVQRIGVRMILYTDISKDGMLEGPNWVALKNLLIGAPQLRIIASGGVSTKDDVAMLRSLSGVYGVVIGKALYDGKLKLSEIL